MSDLEKYINGDNDLDVLIRVGLVHYQFETIHPFLDGNGRIGRLLIILFLMDKKIISSPILYTSYFLKKNRTEYYDRLSEVRRNGNYEQWLKFFLEAIAMSAEDGISTIKKLIKLHEKNSAVISHFGRSSKTALRLLEYLEKQPIIEIGKTSNDLNITFKTVASNIKKLVESDILIQSGGKDRNKIFFYKEYLKILR